MIPNKFTQEIKDNWLKALKSGKYKQGFYNLVSDETIGKTYCCIGVLADCTEGLNCNLTDPTNSPYNFLEKTIGNELMVELYRTNDKGNPKRDYSNVIPLIEALPVQE